MSIWQELGISGGTAIILLIAFYFNTKWAVKNGVREALNIKDKMEEEELEFIDKILKDKKNNKTDNTEIDDNDNQIED